MIAVGRGESLRAIHAGDPRSVCLKASLPSWLPSLRKLRAIAAETERQLLAISAPQIDGQL